VLYYYNISREALHGNYHHHLLYAWHIYADIIHQYDFFFAMSVAIPDSLTIVF